MMEYTIYFITLFGLILKTLSHGWSSSALAPMSFCGISAIVITRAALSHPIGAAGIFFYFMTVLFTYRVAERGGFTSIKSRLTSFHSNVPRGPSRLEGNET
jgi:hypothetical protein